METSSAAPSRSHMVPVAFTLAVLALTGALFAAPIDADTTRLASQFASVLTAVMLVLALLGATRRTSGLDQLAWALLFVPTAIGILAFSVDPVDPAAPVVDISMAFHVGPWVTLAQIGAIALFARKVLQSHRARAIILDSAWLGLAALLINWNLVGGPVLDHPTVSQTALFSLVAQTIMTALLIGFMATIIGLTHRNSRLALFCVALPPALLTLGQGIFAHDFVRGQLTYGSLGDFMFPVVFGIGAIAVMLRPNTAAIRPHTGAPGRRAMLITWIPIGAWVLTTALDEASWLPDQRGLGIAVAIVGVARLTLLADEVTRLARDLHRRATHDSLTGLPNRAALADLIDDIGDAPAGLLMVDLDRFKAVNDTLGHNAGDELLTLVSRRLGMAAGPEWTVTRLAGDEFVIVSTQTVDLDEVVAIGHRIVERLSLPFHLDGREAWIGASVGAAATDEQLHASDLLDVADLALRTAKDDAKGEVVTADEDVRRRARDRGDLEAALRFAVDREELFSLFQPKVDLTNGAMVGVEALVRWQRPGVGVVPPGEFIAVAEASGLIARVDSWVMANGVAQLRRWNEIRSGMPRLKLSTNMSAWQLARIDVDDEVARTLAWEGGVDPAQLTIELTETLLVEDPEVVARRLRRIADTGVGISVDDFGAGFTSVAYLRKFPISEVKIDRALVWELTGGPEDDESLAAAVIALARAMNLDVVAEGVETLEQAAALRRLGCRIAQGFLFAKPLPVEEIDQLVNERYPFAEFTSDPSAAVPSPS